MQDYMVEMLTEENKEVLKKHMRLSTEDCPCALHYDLETNKFTIIDVISNG
jgi:hypothetical protein